MSRQSGASQAEHQHRSPVMVVATAGSYQPALSGGAEFLELQRDVGNRAVSEWLKAGMHTSMVEGDSPILLPGNDPIPKREMIQTKAINPGSSEPAEQQADSAAREVTSRTETGAVVRSLIVDDDTQTVQAGQMRKGEFLSQLRTSTTDAVAEALSGTMWSAMGCPYLERWFSHYEGQSAQHVERAVQRYTPEARAVSNARDYIPLVTSRLRRGIDQWRETGQVPPDVPEEFASGGMPGITAGGLIGGLVGGALSAIGGAVSGLVSGAARAVSSVGSMLFKEREGSMAKATDPETVKAQLGSGRSLDGAAKSRMESAFGASFSGVRIHTDAKAHQLSDAMNARAFTIGSDIAFGAGEYSPGTLVGDALIAHELAHVAQQRGADSSAQPLQKQGGQSNAFEEEADASAVSAVIGLWGRSKLAMAHVGENAMPRLQSGLQLQRCSRTPAVRSPADVQREFDTVREQILGGLPADSPTRLDLEIDMQDLWQAYESELQGAGNDSGRQAEIQQQLHNGLQRMRETAPLQVRLTTRYGISFTARSTFTRERGEMHQVHRAWTTEELRIVDAALSRVPRNYLSNIRKIQRNPAALDPTVGQGDSTPRPHTAASWQQNSSTLQIYNLFFQRPDYERLGLILHEIGHSTVTSPEPAAAGGFAALPPRDWMLLSDWQTATSNTLAASVGINQTQATQLISELTANKRTQGGNPRPVERNGRMIVYDKYETGDMNRPPTRFLHYERGKPFISDYARTHPAEDLAESFSRYLHDPQITLLQTGARSLMGDDKWRYLESHYPQGLQSASPTPL